MTCLGTSLRVIVGNAFNMKPPARFIFWFSVRVSFAGFLPASIRAQRPQRPPVHDHAVLQARIFYFALSKPISGKFSDDNLNCRRAAPLRQVHACVTNQPSLIHLNDGTGTQQLRAQRPAARPRLAVVRRATGQGEKQATQKAEDDVEQMAAPEGDRALAGAPMEYLTKEWCAVLL